MIQLEIEHRQTMEHVARVDAKLEKLKKENKADHNMMIEQQGELKQGVALLIDRDMQREKRREDRRKRWSTRAGWVASLSALGAFFVALWDHIRHFLGVK